MSMNYHLALKLTRDPYCLCVTLTNNRKIYFS